MKKLVIVTASQAKELLKGKSNRGVPTGEGPEGEGPGTGRGTPPQKPKRENFKDDATFFAALKKWRYAHGKEKE